MLESYTTATREGSGQYEEKKSVFYGFIKPMTIITERIFLSPVFMKAQEPSFLGLTAEDVTQIGITTPTVQEILPPGQREFDQDLACFGKVLKQTIAGIFT